VAKAEAGEAEAEEAGKAEAGEVSARYIVFLYYKTTNYDRVNTIYKFSTQLLKLCVNLQISNNVYDCANGYLRKKILITLKYNTAYCKRPKAVVIRILLSPYFKFSGIVHVG